MSAHGNGLPWMALPLAQGTIDEQERLGIGGLYGGNALTPGIAPGAGYFYYKVLQRRQA